MSRMNVQIKVELLKVYGSYWEMLSPEVQEYILMFKRNQQKIDEERNDRMKKSIEEIKLYEQLKAKWGLGQVTCEEGNVYGYCDNRKMFLGCNFEQAMSRVNHVKSFF